MASATLIGQVARGEDYFPRPQITNEIWARIEAGSNLLLVAPRRVGKSSILFNLLDKPEEDRTVVYYTCESVNNENEFYRKLFHHVTDTISAAQKYKAKVSSFIKDMISRIESVSTQGEIGIGASKISFRNEFENLVRRIDIEDDRIIVLVDEFAQAVENIMQDEGDRAAIHFLETVREIRQAPQLLKKLQFVFAGSIGLENIVARINGSSLINDLVPISIVPLNREEANAFVKRILRQSHIRVESDAYTYLLHQIEWWIPFYFQIIVDEAINILTQKRSDSITKATIDDAITRALGKRIYFDQWLIRLRKAYQGPEFSFVKELLNCISKESTIDSLKLYDLAVKYKVEDSHRELVNALKHDGYINNNDDPKIYRFNSPLLREWWRNNVAD